MWSRAEIMFVTAYMILVLRVLHNREKYAARYSTSLNPKLDNELFVFERWNYCAGAAMLLHTILSLKQTLYLQKQGEKEMFEITYSDSEIFEDYQNAGKAHKGGTYDFTFENQPTTVELTKTDLTKGKELPGVVAANDK